MVGASFPEAVTPAEAGAVVVAPQSAPTIPLAADGPAGWRDSVPTTRLAAETGRLQAGVVRWARLITRWWAPIHR